MPRKPKPHRTPIKSPSRRCSDDDDKSRFVFTVDPQCIITFPIDHCLYVCDICSSVLKTQDCFKKHYINLHINHAHATLSDLKFCEAFPINLSKFKEDEGWFRCHFCINLFFNEKSNLKSHLNQHDPLQEIPEDKTVMETEEPYQKPEANEKSDGFSLLEAISRNYQENGKVSETHVKHFVEPVQMYVNELIPLPSIHDDNLVAISSKCNQDESDYEPLSGLLGSSLNTLFNTSINVPPETHASTSNCIQSTSITSHLERSSSPIFAQDCPSSLNVLLQLSSESRSIESTPVLQCTLEDVPVVSSYYTLSSLPESGITSLTLPPKQSSRSSPSSSSGFSSASTDELQQFEDNDVFESSVVRSEESFSSVTSSKSNSDEETPPVGKNLSEINIDNIVLSCLFCDKIFASIKSTKTHMLKSHQANETHWECVFCQINFKNCDLLLNHLCSNHSDVYFACISCKVRFDSKAFMDTHFQIKHNSENDTKCETKYSESKNTDYILYQLKCIPYYTNQNVKSNSLSRKIRMQVFAKLNSSKKKYNQKQVTNKSIQVTEDDISQECNQESIALKSTASILKRKLTEDHPVSHRHSTRSKIIKMSKTFMKDFKEEESMLPVKSPHNHSCEQKVSFEIKSVREEFTTYLNGVDKEMKTEAEEETETNNSIEVLCLFCNKTSSSEKGSKAHVARIHKMRRGGKHCCYCRSNFRTLDLLFNHLCSNHSQVYFACSFCKERFNGKSSLLIHFESNHNSVNINTEDIEENVKNNSNIQQKELFMFELKCLPTYSYTPICSSNCSCCASGNGEELSQHSDIAISMHTSPDPTKSQNSELETISTSENSLLQNNIHDQEQQEKQLQNVLDNNEQDQQSILDDSISVENSLATYQTMKHDQGGLQEESKLDITQNSSTLHEIVLESDLLKEENQRELVSQNLSTPQLIGMELDLSKDSNQVESIGQKPSIQQEIGTEPDLLRDNRQVELMIKEVEVTSGFVEHMDSSLEEHKISSANKSGSYLDSSGFPDETLENSRNKIFDEHWKERFCLYCDRMFEKGKAYRVHLFRSHKAKKNKCMFCESIFKYHDDLFSHLASTHKEVYFACGICMMRFDTKCSCNNHVDQYHNPDKKSENSVPPEESSSSSQTKTSDGLELTEANVFELNSTSENSGEQDVPEQFEKSKGIENGQLKGNGPIQPTETITSGQTREESMIMQTEDNFKQTEEHGHNQNKDVNSESKCLDTFKLTNNESPKHIQIEEIKSPLPNESGETTVELAFSKYVNFAQSGEVKSLLDHLISNVEVATNCVHEFACVQKCSRRVLDAGITKSNCSSSISSQEPLLRVQEQETNKDSSKITNDKETKLSIETANEVVSSVPKLSDPNTHYIAAKYKTTNPRQLINYAHPEYKNIAQRDYSQLDITVQIQILDRVKSFTNGKICTAKYPSKRPQRQQKLPGPVSGKREFSGEWARAKNYFCANCGSHFVNFWDFDVHRWNAHPNVACSVYDFYVEDTPPCYFEPTSWPYNRVPQQTIDFMKQQTKQSANDSVKQCTKCGKSFVHSASFHKHLITCSQQNRTQHKAKVSWKEPDKLNGSKRKRRSCRGLKSILDTPPKLPPSHVFTTNSRKSPRARIKTSKERLLSDKTNRSLFSFDKDISSEELNASKGELMLTRSQSAISNIDEKTKELIEKFERGKYSNHNNAESFTRRLTKTKPKDCS
uniref:C2H2-type domain-containing protein n=1 Tax=Cacopsylla melanoneura TaxID=428564 RepID=A0A8D8WLP6_9HEMI